MTDRTVSFKLLSNGSALPEPPTLVPSPTTHWRDSYFDDVAAAAAADATTTGAPSSSTSSSPFSQLGDTAIRHQLWATKALLDPIPDDVYYKARNVTFPLAVGGAQGSQTFYNRAGHKLNEVMEVTGIWNTFVRSAGQVAASSGKHTTSAAATTSSAAAGEDNANDGADTPIAPMPTKGGSNKMNVKGRTAFIDLCGGPGSFAQAIFGAYPRRHKAKLVGFGLTLKDPNMADKHNNATDGWYPNLLENKNFHPTFGVNGEGDIYKMSNIHSIMSITEGMPLLLAVADGGFEVPSEDANYQETISMRLAYCQWHAALCVLQPGGAFVLKLFDTFSPAMRSMLYLTTKFFEATFIVKPKHSRAVNSERYLAAKGFKGMPSAAWARYLQAVHDSAFTNDALPATLIPAEWMVGTPSSSVVVAASADGAATTPTNTINIVGGDSAFEGSMVAMNKAIATNQIEAITKVMDSTIIKRHLGTYVEEEVVVPATGTAAADNKRPREEADGADPRAAAELEGGAQCAAAPSSAAAATAVVASAEDENFVSFE